MLTVLLLISITYAGIFTAISYYEGLPDLRRPNDLGGVLLLLSWIIALYSLLGWIAPKIYKKFLGPRAKRSYFAASFLLWFIIVPVIMTVMLINRKSTFLDEATFYNGDYSEPKFIAVTDAQGQSNSFYAYPGEVLLSVKSKTKVIEVDRAVKALGGKVVAKIPKLGFYLALVSGGRESEFIKNISAKDFVALASPNLVLELTSSDIVDLSDKGKLPFGFVPALISGVNLGDKVVMYQIDDFGVGKHGERVLTTAGSVAGDFRVVKIQARARECGKGHLIKELCGSVDQDIAAIAAAIAGAELNKQKANINLSWGVSPETADPNIFVTRQQTDANSWAAPTIERYLTHVLSAIDNSQWAKQGNVLLHKSAGNGAKLKDAQNNLLRLAGVDLTKTLKRLRERFPDVMEQNIRFYGALNQAGAKEGSSNFGEGVLFARLPSGRTGTSHIAPQGWASSYSAWTKFPQLSSADIAKSLSTSTTKTRGGLTVLNLNKVTTSAQEISFGTAPRAPKPRPAPAPAGAGAGSTAPKVPAAPGAAPTPQETFQPLNFVAVANIEAGRVGETKLVAFCIPLPSSPNTPCGSEGPTQAPVGGKSPYTFTLTASGSLFGLDFYSNGVLYGPLTSAGTTKITICVTDSAGQSACGNSVLTVLEKEEPAAAPPPELAPVPAPAPTPAPTPDVTPPPTKNCGSRPVYDCSACNGLPSGYIGPSHPDNYKYENCLTACNNDHIAKIDEYNKCLAN